MGFSDMMNIFYLHELNFAVFVILRVFVSFPVSSIRKRAEIWPGVNNQQINITASLNNIIINMIS